MLLSFPVTNQELYLIEESTGVLWFKAFDVCSILGFSNPTAATSNHCPDDTKMIDYQQGRGRAALFVSEPGLYLLIMESKSPLARDFKDWLARKVLPDIRRTGSFGDVSNVQSEASDFWQLIDGALSRGLDPNNVIGWKHFHDGKLQPALASVSAKPQRQQKPKAYDWLNQVEGILPTLPKPLTTPAILKALKQPNIKSNQMAVATRLTDLGYQSTRRRVEGTSTRVWI